MEKNVTICVQGVRLEGRLNLNPDSKKGVVVTHPHPLYGGNMDNPVVKQIVASFYGAGFTTLRFNFRGTKGSSGMFDNGGGEQDDVRFALAFLNDHGISTPFLAGYSFGSWVNAHVVAKGVQIKDHIMVSPPVAFISFDTVKTLSNTGLIITGQGDDIAPPNQVRAVIQRWQINPQFSVLDRGDHFYSAHLKALGEVLTAYLA